jgi:HD superfamily phosphodiesterase
MPVHVLSSNSTWAENDHSHIFIWSRNLITNQLLKAIQNQYRLTWHGTHGIGHWARVRENGLYIAENLIGVNKKIIELFAVFHDSARQNEHSDNGHGFRGAELAKQLRGTFFELGDQDFELYIQPVAIIPIPTSMKI